MRKNNDAVGMLHPTASDTDGLLHDTTAAHSESTPPSAYRYPGGDAFYESAPTNAARPAGPVSATPMLLIPKGVRQISGERVAANGGAA